MSRLLGVDPGQRYVGLSCSDEKMILARPLKTVDLVQEDDFKTVLEQLIDKLQVHKVIVGYPEPLQTNENERTKQVDEFISNFIEPLSTPYEKISERYTTKKARELRKRRGEKSDDNDDAEAAALILQNYLDDKQ